MQLNPSFTGFISLSYTPHSACLRSELNGGMYVAALIDYIISLEHDDVSEDKTMQCSITAKSDRLATYYSKLGTMEWKVSHALLVQREL